MIEQVIKKRMELAGITQASLAESSGTTPSQMGLFLKGKATLNRETLDKCLESLGINLNIQKKRAELASQVALKLKNLSLEEIKSLTKEEMAKLSGFDKIVALPDVDLKEFENMVKSGIVDYESTFPFFKVLVMHYHYTGTKITGRTAKDSFNTIISLSAGAFVSGAVGLIGGLLLSPIAMAANKLLDKKILSQSSINAWTPFLTMTYNLLKKK